MDKKYTESIVSRRDALKKIGQCAEYTGAVVAFLTVSKPAWASVGGGTKPGCSGIGVSLQTPQAGVNGCIDIELSRNSQSASATGTGRASGVGQTGGSGAAVSTQSTGGINNSVSLKVDNAVDTQAAVGPSYQ